MEQSGKKPSKKPETSREPESESFEEWFQQRRGRKLTDREKEVVRESEAYSLRCYRKSLTHQQKALALAGAEALGDL